MFPQSDTSELAKLYHVMGRVDLAEQCYVEALSQPGGESFVNLALLSLIQSSKGQDQLALSNILKASKLAPQIVELKEILVQVAERCKELSTAIEAQREISKVRGSSIDLTHLGDLLYEAYLVAKGISSCNSMILEPAQSLINESVRAYNRSLETSPTNLENYTKLRTAYFIQGKAEETLATIQRYYQAQSQAASNLGLDSHGLRLLPSSMPGNIGVISMLEILVKSKILDTNLTTQHVLPLDSQKKCANRAFLDYFSDFIQIVDDPHIINQLAPAENHLTDWTNWDLEYAGERCLYLKAASEIRNTWHQQNRPPLLVLSCQDRERGRAFLKSKGVPEDAWYVTLHVREASTKNDAGSDSYRDSRIEDYLPAIKEITARGGWVFRMGDSSMQPLPEMPQVIDYATACEQADWLDVFLVASSKFMMATSSGLVGVAYCFGIPTVHLNTIPYGSMSASPTDLYIPKLLWSLKEKRFLRFNEMFSDPICKFFYTPLFAELGVRPVDNTPEEIVDVVREMYLSCETYNEGVLSKSVLQSQIDAITTQAGTCFGAAIYAKMGSTFLEKHQTLIDATY